MVLRFPRCPKCKLSASVALGTLVLCWFYIYPVNRLPSDNQIINEVLQLGQTWKKNETTVHLYRELLMDCCDPREKFAVTRGNTPLGTVLWYDGELFYFHTVSNHTYPLFVQESPIKVPLKKCAVVGNGGILKGSGCGGHIDRADFVMRCNLPPLSEDYTQDVGSRTHLVTANPSIIVERFQGLMWSRKAFVESMRAYGRSFVYMPAFSSRPGTDPSLRAGHALADSGSEQTVLFASPDFLRSVERFWKGRGVRARRLSTGLFLASLALGLCEEVELYGFWPFAKDPRGRPVGHHYYNDVPPLWGVHAMPEEFLRLWELHKGGALRMRVDSCPREAD
ncbi:alpha-N-acetylneuraminide alpha-2,8-sialyltransferase-like isoform X1 [Anguilla anguilla]|uniref:alpha-N-acetylneuraminide alpha-2,8-sialyltransferase-like isoform X1 n=1 Tax=Anguilla anguilla TaxID=7936 RepID=UPI0015B34418|nr:alpha-N-acetylneuraminide alpha-2,8-sialyltransferase-like isoform X1 [Anguilla anguilla]